MSLCEERWRWDGCDVIVGMQDVDFFLLVWRWPTLSTGRFLQTHSADDILFGNTFDRPLKLPWGSGAALKFMKYALLPPLLVAVLTFHLSQ